MKICRLTLCFTLAIAMTVTMMPWLGGAANNVYAETSTANGGSVLSNSVDNVNAAFGSENVIVEQNDQNIAITLQKDISLLAPVLFQRGDEGDTVTLNLNGHTIYGPAGENGTNRDSAIGKNTIEIIPADFNVVIQGEGSVIGGHGAVYESVNHKKYGMDGGEAISFTGTGNMSDYWYPDSDDAELQYGLTVTCGSILTGGAGADMTGEDWVYSIDQFNGATEHEMSNNPQFTLSAGAGGAGIGQTDTEIEYGASTLAYTKIEIDDGIVIGGKGGSIDLGTNSTPVLTHYSLMNSSVIDQYMHELSNTSNTYDDYVANAISFVPGDGGDGIMIGAGRKYLCTEQATTVSGGSCGTVDYGKSKRLSRFGCETAESGDGIGIFGDIGLKNVDVNINESNWESKTKASDDMGVYIAGTVKGGDSQDADAMNEASGNAGDGIVIHDGKMHSKYEYSDGGSLPFPSGEEYVKWGIVEIDAGGRVSGGNGGRSVCGSPGGGGHGICESYTKADGPSDSLYGTDYYIIKGTVEGGSGGDSLSGVSGGGPGNGLSFGNYRKNTNVLGNGSVAGGDYGCIVDRNGSSNYDENDSAEGIRFYPANREDWNNTVMNSVTETAGGSSGQQININNSGLSAKASMTSFSSVPTTSTKLACSITKPSGYMGGVFIKWFAELSLQSDVTVCDIEPSGTNSASFDLRSDAQYKYLAYPTYPSHPENGTSYNVAVATASRIGYVLSHSNSYVKIWCEVQLDDGRWAKSNVMTVKSGEGWKDSSPAIADPDQKAADAVAAMIKNLPKLAVLSLDDLEAVEAARAAYDALTEDQKALLAPYTYLLNDLEATEQKIEGLKAAVTAVEDQIDILINTLPVLSEINPNDATAIAEAKAQIEAAKYQIAAAVAEYNALADNQKDRVDAGKIAALTEFVESYNGLAEDDEDIDTLVLPGKRLTTDMITVANATYTGKALMPAVTVKDGDKVLAEGTDYTKKYSNNINAGKGKVTVTGKGAYRRAVTKDFIINPKTVTPSVTLSTKKYTYNAKARKPGVTVKVGNSKLAATQYSVSYAAGRKNVGTYKVTVNLKGNYKGTKAASFTIVPKGATIVKPKPAKKALTVKWKKQAAKMSKSRITGYQVQCCTSKAFKSGVKKKTVKGYGKTSVRISKLKKKTYYVRVRTYKKTGGKTYYSNWSKVLKTKTK